ncbi:hypothetical protein CCAX7_41740 [Capsulimonas corticalis]|uniref:Uncharacterized protein n=1 Tax=Capsulimonas corticalis TaxID=2219043 RepID=A0A402CY07_9BACT|nr:hypothetical protein [Capsulimonas corticalis]BDI32123.1 hypothetical protein CCAX7_41740 [Capsulimonas corticalis]
MEQETPSPKDLALLFVLNEQAAGSLSAGLHDAIQRTFEKLNAHLSKRLGSGGYHALLKRAFVLAAAEHPKLSMAQVGDHGKLEGLDAAFSDHESAELTEACVAILACLIDLLDMFIGRKLRMRMLNDVWPSAALTGKDGPEGESHG